MHSYSRLVLLAALAGGARGAPKPSKDIGARNGRVIHGQSVYPEDHVLARADEVTLVIKTTSAQGALAALGAGTEAVASSNNNVWYINVPIASADAVMTKLEQNSGVQRVEFDEGVSVPPHEADGDQRRLRRLAEDVPYGIGMVLEDVEWWEAMFVIAPPTGSTKLCVVDTGYDNGHEDLPVLPQTNAYGYNPYDDGEWYVDGHSHGTHCAGSIGAIGDNEKGVVGVIPGSLGDKFSFFIGKGLEDSGSGSNTGVMAAVQKCVDKGSNVISMSLGGSGYSNTFDEQYYGHYKDDDVLIIAAAGNAGNSMLSYPASYKSVMSVAAVDSSGNKASFSQYNEQTEVAGPGVGTVSTVPGSYGTKSGTSMATPHVAAVAGLLRMYFPLCKAFQIRSAMLVTALHQDGCDHDYGHGLVRAKKAFEYLTDNACDPDEPFKEPVGGCAEYSCSANSDCDDGNPDTIDTCQSGTCTHGCTSDAGCDDGNACTTDTCHQHSGVCNHVDVEDGPFTRTTVSLTTDNYPTETTWEIKDATSGTTMLEGSGYSDANTLHESSYCSVEGHTATFTITDAYGDGICCNFGSGSYSIKVDGVDEPYTGGQFESSEVKNFDVPAYSGSPSPPVVSPTNPPVAPPTTPPVVSPTNPPVAPPVSAPTNPPVGGDNPVPGTINIDLFTVQFTFTPIQACVSPDIASPTGASEFQCAQACAYMDGCAGFVKPAVGHCVLSLGPADDDCEDGDTVLFYERSAVMHFDN